jgi:hypothetical protein
MGMRLRDTREEDRDRAAEAPADEAIARVPAEEDSALSPAQVLALQHGAGNAAVTGLLQRQEGGTATAEAPAATGEAPAAIEEDIYEPELAPEEAKAEPEHPAPPKLTMDLASGEKVLGDAYGKIKKIVPGKIEILEPADFKKAYDKIYGATQWSWDKYVVPTYGSLNGFAHDGTNYINKGSAGLHTVVHEMLHNNTAGDWRGVVGSRWDEGTTEVLTQEACQKFSVDAPTCYPGESPVVREAISNGLSLDDLSTAYLTGGAQAKVADWADKNCKENWAAIKGHMEAKSWAAAKAALAKKA